MTQLAIANTTDAPRVPSPYRTVEDVAIALKVSVRRVRQRCDQEWGPTGLAKKFNGTWGVHPRADQRLHQHGDTAKRDREQIAELARSGIAAKQIDAAENRLAILRELADYDCVARDERKRRAIFCEHLRAGGRVPCPGISRISVNTLYRWEQRYRAEGVAGLIRRGVDRQARSEVNGNAALDYIFNLVHSGNNIPVADARRMALGEAQKHGDDPAWRIGSYSSVRLAIEARSPAILKAVAGKGERAAKAACIPKMPRDYESIAANQEWVGDERTIDVMCRVIGSRGWKASRQVKLTAWMDMRSRMIVGWVLATHADSNTILGSLKRGIALHGKPELLRVDWGHDYKKATGSPHHRRWKNTNIDSFDGERVGSILDELGIDVSPAMPYTPWAKPIESFFKTMKDRWDKLNASFWGGCPSERHEDRQKYVNANLEKLPTLEQIEASLIEFIADYHRTPHTAIDMFGKTPMQAMEAFRAGSPCLESAKVLDHLFAEFVGPKMVRRDGVRHNKFWYGHGDGRLVELQGKKVLLRIQPDDASRAMVCKPDRTPMFEVECLFLRGFTSKDAGEIAKRGHRMMRPYRAQARTAAKFLRSHTPEQLTENRRRGVRAERGSGEPDETAAPTFTIRPALEEAIAGAAPAPSDSIEAVSRAVRTGTDDDAVCNPLDDLDVDISEAYAAWSDEDDGEDENPISIEDLIGE